MGRLRAILDAQRVNATRNATAQHPVLRVAHTRECNTQQTDELRELVAIIAVDWTDDERADALAAALADPADALTCYRALVHFAHITRTPAPAREADDGMRTCQQCANRSPGGRCVAAWRGESFGAGITTSRTWTPTTPDRPQRCGAYAPGANDPDRRSGRERWPTLWAT